MLTEADKGELKRIKSYFDYMRKDRHYSGTYPIIDMDILLSIIDRQDKVIEKAVEQRDRYLKDARDDFDQKLAMKTDTEELEKIMQGGGE